MSAPKRVGVLLRVSTQAQARQDGDEADIPAQRVACLRFIAQRPDWVLEKEYREIGVSGYKTAMNDRDQLLEIRDDIAAGRIDVLLVFMFDRLGRMEEETPFVVKSFVEMGAEVWSVREGQRTFNAHVDNLLNYLYFWQASGESKKTSERVTNAMNQMAEAGRFTGGRPPYGYRLAETGRRTKKGLPERTLAILEVEARHVRTMFDLALTRGYGCHRIAAHLNERGVPTRSGGQWGHAAVAGILSNPLYKGIRAYNRTTGKGVRHRQRRLPPDQWILSPPNPDWVIVPPDAWERVALMRKRAASPRPPDAALPRPVKSRLLLAGIAWCGHCGAKLQTGYATHRWKTADGVSHRRDKPMYKCGAKSTGKICAARATTPRDVVEAPVLALFRAYLAGLGSESLATLAARLRAAEQRRAREAERARAELRRKASALRKEKDALEAEVIRVVAGHSGFDKALLNRLIREKTEQLAEAETRLGRGPDDRPREAAPPPPLAWEQVFDHAGHEEKKRLLDLFLSRVEVCRDTVDITLRVRPVLSEPGDEDAAPSATPSTPTRKETP